MYCTSLATKHPKLLVLVLVDATKPQKNIRYAVYTLYGRLIPRLLSDGPKEPGCLAAPKSLCTHEPAPKGISSPKMQLHYVMLHYDHFVIARKAIVAEA